MAAVLFGALLHAVWNALVRAASDKFLNTVLIVGGAGVWTACGLPFAPVPAVESWPYLAASVLIHIAYFSFVALSYRDADLSFVYPIMRGSAPALSAVAVTVLVHESPSPSGWMGVLLVSLGIIVLSGDSWRSGSLRFSLTALAPRTPRNCDLHARGWGGVAYPSTWSATRAGYFDRHPAPCGVLRKAGREAAKYLRFNWGKGLIGACTLGWHGLALWATQAPIALVAALRETSVIFEF
jgi:multidrug transporter EmrE-like cation transporter